VTVTVTVTATATATARLFGGGVVVRERDMARCAHTAAVALPAIVEWAREALASRGRAARFKNQIRGTRDGSVARGDRDCGGTGSGTGTGSGFGISGKDARGEACGEDHQHD
jgi:hypothetical protein